MKISLKHGENPHQGGFVTVDEASDDPLAIHRFQPATGDPLETHVGSMGWVCLTDLFRGVETLARIAAAHELNFGTVPQIAILVQHGNTCGAATGPTHNVLHDAIKCNYRATFGSFLVTNVELVDEVAFSLRQWMPANRPFSGIAAPMIDELGPAFFERKKGRCHVFVNPALATIGIKSVEPVQQVRSIRGATITQDTNSFVPKLPEGWDASLKEDMCLAWGICASSDSNCITVVKDRKLITNAVGQPCRTGAVELAGLQASQSGAVSPLNGSAVVSDSFFAFADGIDMLARKKVRAIFATSGSVHDDAVREHAESFDIIMHTVPDAEGRIFAGH